MLWLIILLGLILFTGGCKDVREVTDTAIPLGIGCELAEINGELKISAQFSAPGGGSTDQPDTTSNKGMVVTSTGRTISEASRKLSTTLPFIPLWAHSETFIIGENLARDDIGLLADYFGRNPYVRETAAMFVSRGSSPDEILNTVTPLQSLSATGLATMIKVQERQAGIYQPVQLNQFFYNLTTSGIEPACPQVAIVTDGGKKILKLNGTAVFKKDRMVGELNETESRAFRMMNSQGVQGGILVIRWDKNTLITIEVLQMNTQNTAIVDKQGRLKMKIELKGEGNFYEQSAPGEILTLKNINKIQTKTEEQIEREVKQCINKVQLMGSDIFGWGLIFQQQNPAAWQEMKSDWPNYFAQIEPEINASYKLRRTYLADKSFVFHE